LFMVLVIAQVRIVIDPDRGSAEVLHREEAICGLDAPEVFQEPLQVGGDGSDRFKIARIEIVVMAIEDEPHAVVQEGSPDCHSELPLHQPGEAVIGGPAIEEIPLQGQSLSERPDKPGGEPMFAIGQIDAMELVASVAAVLLPFATHPIDDCFLSGIVERIE
jgi:hypothetical protein